MIEIDRPMPTNSNSFPVRAAPCKTQRCRRSHSPQSLDASAKRDRTSDPHWTALDQYTVGLADCRRGAALPDRPGSKPARTSWHRGIHRAASRHRAVCAVRRFGVSVVAAASALPEHVLHAVHHASRTANPGRPSAAVLGSRLHAGDRLVPLPGSGSEGPYLDRQGRFRHSADLARHSRTCAILSGCRAGGISRSTCCG